MHLLYKLYLMGSLVFVLPLFLYWSTNGNAKMIGVFFLGTVWGSFGMIAARMDTEKKAEKAKRG